MNIDSYGKTRKITIYDVDDLSGLSDLSDLSDDDPEEKASVESIPIDRESSHRAVVCQYFEDIPDQIDPNLKNILCTFCSICTLYDTSFQVFYDKVQGENSLRLTREKGCNLWSLFYQKITGPKVVELLTHFSCNTNTNTITLKYKG